MLNNITGPVTLDEAIDLARMLVQTGRAIPPSKWIPAYIAMAESSILEGLY